LAGVAGDFNDAVRAVSRAANSEEAAAAADSQPPSPS
jgi:hypothetical protein